MQGVSGTSKSGRIYYYYECKKHRKHKCKLKPVQKDFLERCVIEILREFLSDQGNLASEKYAKESIKDLKINQGSVFDKNAAGST